MHAIDVRGVDLALLPVLDALLRTSSVTLAAKELGLGQPSVSHALGRLRERLGDPILVRAGRAMVPTPRAEALAPAVRRVLADARGVLAPEPAFDATTSARAFRLACPDLLVAILPELLSRLARDAPGVRLEVAPPPAELAERLEEGALDVALVPAREEGPGLAQRVLGAARWCVLARAKHPAVKRGKIDLKAWLAYGHVQVRTAEGTGYVARELVRAGRARRVAFVAPSFLAASYAVAHTDWFFAAPRELTGEVAKTLGLARLEPPLALPPVKVALVWHERMHADAANRWLRGLLASVVGRALGRA